MENKDCQETDEIIDEISQDDQDKTTSLNPEEELMELYRLKSKLTNLCNNLATNSKQTDIEWMNLVDISKRLINNTKPNISNNEDNSKINQNSLTNRNEFELNLDPNFNKTVENEKADNGEEFDSD